MVTHAGRPGRLFVTFVHVAPPSRVTCTRPSLDPVQIVFASIGDSPIAYTTPAYSTPMLSGVRPPLIFWRLLSFRVRSGDITFHVLPPSLVMCRYWLPVYTTLWSCDEIASGAFQTKRYFRLSAGQPIVDSGQISTFCTSFVRRSYLVTMPPIAPEPDALDHTMLPSTVSGVA